MTDSKSCSEIIAVLLKMYPRVPHVISIELSSNSVENPTLWEHAEIRMASSSFHVVPISAASSPSEHANTKYESVERWAEAVGKSSSKGSEPLLARKGTEKADLKSKVFFGMKALSWYEATSDHCGWREELHGLSDLWWDPFRTPATTYKRRRDGRLEVKASRRPLLLSVSGDLLATLWPAEHVVIGMQSCKMLNSVLAKVPSVKLK
jgi:hypothetical protein